MKKSLLDDDDGILVKATSMSVFVILIIFELAVVAAMIFGLIWLAGVTT